MWEYKCIDEAYSLHSRVLNELGRDGWELLGFAIYPPSDGASGWFYYVFKRPIKANDVA